MRECQGFNADIFDVFVMQFSLDESMHRKTNKNEWNCARERSGHRAIRIDDNCDAKYFHKSRFYLLSDKSFISLLRRSRLKPISRYVIASEWRFHVNGYEAMLD